MMLVFWYDDFQHGLAIDFPFFDGVGHFGLAVHFGGGLDHVNFLVGADSGDGAVVFDANEQPSAIGVGKSGQRPGNAPTVGNLKLEVEHLVFAFRNEVLDMVVFLSHLVGKDTDFSNAERPILIRCCKNAIKMGLRLSKKCGVGQTDENGVFRLSERVWFRDEQGVVLEGENAKFAMFQNRNFVRTENLHK